MKNRTTLLALLSALALAAATGCGSGDDGPEGGVSSLALRMEPAPQGVDSACAQESGSCNCPNGAYARLTLVARASDGSEVAVDPSSVSWSSSDSASVEVIADGASADVGGLRDWFDANGSEPTASVTASYAGRQASMPVTVVINASGDWNALLDNGFSYLLSLQQSGRTIVDTGTGYSGRVAGDALTLAVSGINVNARFTSRTQVSGTYASTSGGLHGTLTCTKQ
ncbi:MAG TPA: hypothetical protein VL500_00240 [Candidatus Eisenbacteria bacterium]|nr:hypothetical protein [Candidatus Eisenbacteria bacterium]